MADFTYFDADGVIIKTPENAIFMNIWVHPEFSLSREKTIEIAQHECGGTWELVDTAHKNGAIYMMHRLI